MAIMNQLKTKREALDAMVAKPGTTLADAKGLMDELGKLQAQMLFQMTDNLFTMKEILTPEQFAKVLQKNKEQRNKGPEGLKGRN